MTATPSATGLSRVSAGAECQKCLNKFYATISEFMFSQKWGCVRKEGFFSLTLFYVFIPQQSSIVGSNFHYRGSFSTEVCMHKRGQKFLLSPSPDLELCTILLRATLMAKVTQLSAWDN